MLIIKEKSLVYGGEQLRPNIHIDDMVNVYLRSITADKKIINGQTFNAGYDNFTINEIAKFVKEITGKDVELEKIPTDDNRSYHVSSQKIKDILNFEAKFTHSRCYKRFKRGI